MQKRGRYAHLIQKTRQEATQNMMEDTAKAAEEPQEPARARTSGQEEPLGGNAGNGAGDRWGRCCAGLDSPGNPDRAMPLMAWGPRHHTPRG